MKQLNKENLSPELNNKSGIYRIVINKKSYVGSSINLLSRLREHLYDLEKSIHKNKKIQNAYNKYGDPYFSIIEQCQENDLLDREEFFYNIEGYYNLCAPSGKKNTQSKKVYKFDPEGNLLDTYFSASEAARVNNLSSAAGITVACAKCTHYASGFLWSYTEDRPKRNNKAFRSVYLYDLDGSYVGEFCSFRECCRYIVKVRDKSTDPIVLTNLLRVSLNKNSRQVLGFMVSTNKNETVTPYKSRHNKNVYVKDSNGNICGTFSSPKEASIALGKSIKALYDLIYRKTKIDNDYYLTY